MTTGVDNPHLLAHRIADTCAWRSPTRSPQVKNLATGLPEIFLSRACLKRTHFGGSDAAAKFQWLFEQMVQRSD
jgi:hypothetical protein